MSSVITEHSPRAIWLASRRDSAASFSGIRRRNRSSATPRLRLLLRAIIARVSKSKSDVDNCTCSLFCSYRRQTVEERQVVSAVWRSQLHSSASVGHVLLSVFELVTAGFFNETTGCSDRGNIDRLRPEPVVRYRAFHATAQRMVCVSGTTRPVEATAELAERLARRRNHFSRDDSEAGRIDPPNRCSAGRSHRSPR